MNQGTHTWRIAEIREEAPNVRTLFLEAIGERPTFIPGQFLTVTLPNVEPKEGKSYSISSIPEDDRVTITVKGIGEFSNALLARKVGETLTTSAPFGFFYPSPDHTERDLAFIAGGIGIAPIVSMVRALTLENDTRRISLLYSNRTQDDIVFFRELEALANMHERFSLLHFITRESAQGDTIREGRITAEHICETITNHAKTDFFVCGSVEFVKDITKMLRSSQISSSQIYTEGFF